MRVIENIEVIAALRENYGVDLGYEAVLERSYRRFLKSGDVVLDIGAHNGLHTVKFLECVGDAGLVVAFEPLPDVHRFLLRSLGTRPNLMIFELALSSAPAARAEFVRAEGSLSESGLKRREYNDPDSVTPTTTHVEISTIDEVVNKLKLGAVNYIKMDIEGAELDAVAGGSQTIRRFRPIISLEYGPQAYGAYGYHADSLFEVAEQLGYRIFDPFLQDIGDRQVWNFTKHRYCWDFFIVPLERAAEARGWNALPA